MLEPEEEVEERPEESLRILAMLFGVITVVLSLVAAPRLLNPRDKTRLPPGRQLNPPGPQLNPPGPTLPEQPPTGAAFSAGQREQAGRLEPFEGGDPGEIYETPRRLNIVMVAVGMTLLVMTTGDLALRGFARVPSSPSWAVPGGDTRHAQLAIAKYGCGGCHNIPGIHEATGRVGPMLTDFKRQGFIAGKLPNVPHNLVNWIQNPQQIDPGVAMPNLGVTRSEAKDIADFLYAQSGK